MRSLLGPPMMRKLMPAQFWTSAVLSQKVRRMRFPRNGAAGVTAARPALTSGLMTMSPRVLMWCGGGGGGGGGGGVEALGEGGGDGGGGGEFAGVYFGCGGGVGVYAGV